MTPAKVWKTCWFCKGDRFLRINANRNMACPICKLDGCLIVTPKDEKKVDKLIEDLNL